MEKKKKKKKNPPNNLEIRRLVEVTPSLPIILGKRILDTDNGILGRQGLVLIGQLLIRNPLGRIAVGILEIEIVLFDIRLVELARRHVDTNVDLARVPGLLDGTGNDVESLFGRVNIGRHTTLITDIARRRAILLLDQGLELVIDLGTLAKSLGEGWSRVGNDHEFLEGQPTTGVATAVQNVHERHWQDVRLLGPREIGHVRVQRDPFLGRTGLGDGQADAEDGIGSQFGLVGRSVQFVDESIGGRLVLDIDIFLDDGRSDDLIDILDRSQDT